MELRLKTSLSVLSALLLCGCLTAQSRNQPATLPLDSFIEQAMAIPPFDHALWGILIEEEDGRILYERNADVLMMPASNRKLFVANLATECLGVASTISTELWLNGSVEAETLHGDLVLKGHGDPSLGGRYQYDRDQALQPFLQAIRDRRITSITGAVIGDVSRFDREIIPGSWKYDNLGDYYAAPVDALAWNENVAGVLLDARDCSNIHVTTDPNFVAAGVELTCVAPPPPQEKEDEILPDLRADIDNEVTITGTIDTETASKLYGDLAAVSSPGLYAAQALDDFLRRNGIVIANPPTLNSEARDWTEKLTTIESPPLYLLLGTFLKSSQNLYGEMFFKLTAGETPASYARARQIETMFLNWEVGIGATEFEFADGSGLSVENLTTPRAIVKLLRYMNRPERFGLYYQLLATPGEEGTLRRRLVGLENSMRGKTGTIDGVNALSGYLIGRSGQLRYFSIIANHHIGQSSTAIEIIDHIIRRIADF